MKINKSVFSSVSWDSLAYRTIGRCVNRDIQFLVDIKTTCYISDRISQVKTEARVQIRPLVFD